MGLGVFNGLPFRVGGGKTLARRIYDELRKAVGEGGAGPAWSANPRTMLGAEDFWRICKAKVLAAALRADERAMLQFFPAWATDALPFYEEALGLAEEPTTAQRQAAAAAAWTLQISADIPTLRDELFALSPKLSIEALAYAQATISMFGKQFGPRTGGPPFGSGMSAGVQSSAWPNFASDFVLYVRYTLGAGETKVPNDLRATVSRYLCERLPSFVDFQLSTGSPFYLDGGPDGTSLLDQTAFG